MKANLKGLGGVKHLLLAHGEKLGIVIVGICALMMIYHSLLRDKLPADKQADRLNEKITLARQDMTGYTWDRFKADHPDQPRLFKPLEQKKDNTVDRSAYVNPNWNIPWDPPVVPPTVLRTDPLLLAAQALEGNGGSGLLAYADPEVRKQKMLDEQKKTAQLNEKQRKEQEKQQEEEGRRGNRNRGRNDAAGENVYDPLHPDRKPVPGMVRPRGVALQDYEEVRVVHWAVVVAKIPIKEQVKLYRDAFENARDSNPAADIPQYLGYYVERAEVLPGDDKQELKWQRVSVYDGKSTILIAPVVTADALYGKPEDPGQTARKPAANGVVGNWVAQMPEIVDPRYVGDTALAFPLPPLVGRDWGSEVTHSDIPLAIDAVELEGEEPAEAEVDAPAAPAEGEPTDFFSGAAAAGAGRQSTLGGGNRGTGMMNRGGGYGGGGYGGGGEMDRGGSGYSAGRGGGGGRDNSGGLGAAANAQAPHWLLRFFDFSVTPGAKYKYRVQLAMLDPNQSFGTRYVGIDSLDQDAQQRIKAEKKGNRTPVRLTEWSKPTAPVSIPLAGNVRVVSTKPATDKFNDEPSTKMLVESFGIDAKRNANQAAEEGEFTRGSVANMNKEAKVLVESGRAYDTVKNFPFRTDITVVDIRGGERLTRVATRPAQVLLMGPAGQLFVQNELEDAEAVEMHNAAFSEDETGGSNGFFGREGRGNYGGR